MRVAYILPSLSAVGGWRSHARGLLGAVSSHVEPVLYYAEEDRPVIEEVFPKWDAIPLPATHNAQARRSNAAVLGRTYRAIMFGRHPEVDLLQSLEAYPTGMIGHWLANRLSRPHVITVHGTFGVLAKRRRLDRFLYRRVLKDAAALCPVSTGTGRQMEKHFGSALSGALMRPILNGNDFYQKVSREDALRRKPAGPPTILSVGAAKPRKGYGIGLEAFARVKKVLPNARYHIVGSLQSSKYVAELRRLIDRLELRDVSILGPVDDAQLRRSYGEASVFVLPAQQVGLRFEGFGLVLLEAGAFGVPVVGTRSGGVADAIRDGETGLVVDPGNVEGLAAALLRILSDQRLARRMGSSGRDWAETLTWQRYATEQRRIYDEVLALPCRDRRFSSLPGASAGRTSVIPEPVGSGEK